MIKNFDYKFIEGNYKKLLKEILSSDVKKIGEDEDGLRILTKSYDRMLNSLDYERLDDYYEHGLSDENIMDDDADILTVGYALITKYRLPYDDFYKWASEQERRYLVVLYNLIGINPPIEKRKNKSKKADTTISDSLIKEIENLDKVLFVSDVSSKWPILGKSIMIPEEELNIVQLRGEISDIDYQSIVLFENEFARSCTDCNSALTNVETSMAFAINAELVKCKKLLAKKNIDGEIIKVIENRFKEISDVSEVSSILREALENGITELKKAASMAKADYDRRSDTEFVGGGFGIKGSLAGMLTANVMGAVYDSFSSSHYKGDLERMTNKFKASMDKQFVGVEAKDKYIETLLDIFESLKQICVEEIYKNRRSNSDRSDSFISKLEKCEGAISGDVYRNIVVDLLCAFPYDKSIYEYINRKFAGVNKELEKIAKALDIKFDTNSSLEKNTKIKDVQKNSSKYKNLSYIEINELLAEESKRQGEEYFENSENKEEYAFNISFRKNVKAIIHGTEYSDRLVNDYAYNLADDRVIEVVSRQDNKAQYVLYLSGHTMLTDTALYIAIGSDNFSIINVREISEIVVGENFYLGGGYRACLVYRNGDLRQVELGVENEEDALEYAFIFDVINIALDSLSDSSRVRMYKKSYVTGAGNVAFCEKCGIQRFVSESRGIFNNHKCGKCHSDVFALSRIVKNNLHDKCDINLEREFIRLAESELFEDENELASKHEIKMFENKRDVEFDNRVLGAYKAQIDIKNGARDYNSAAQYRAILKKFFSAYDNRYVVNQYDYEILGEITEYLVDKEKIGQYVIYSDDDVAITDFNVYIRDKNGYTEIPLFDLLEIIPIEKGIKGGFVGYIYRHKNGKFEKAYAPRLVSNVEVIWQLNVALAEISKIRNKKSYMQYFDKRYDKRDDAYVYCNVCKKYVTRYCVPGKAFNEFHCSGCNSDMMFGGFDRAVATPKEDELIEAKKTILSIVQLDLNELIASEIAEDKAKYAGVLEYGIQKHEEYNQIKKEQKKQREIDQANENEEEKKILARYNSLFGKYRENVDGCKKGFFVKENVAEDTKQKLSKMRGQGLYIGAIDSWGYTTKEVMLSSKIFSIKGLKKVRTVRCFTYENGVMNIPSKTFLLTDDSFECKDFTKKLSDNLYCIDSGVILDEYGDMDFFNALIGDKESEKLLSKKISVFVYCRRCGEISSILIENVKKHMGCPCCGNAFLSDEYIIIGSSRLSKDEFFKDDILSYLNLDKARNHSFEGNNLRELLENNNITGFRIEGDESFSSCVANARQKYVSLDKGELPIVIYNMALFKEGSKGFLISNKKLYINTGYSKSVLLSLSEIERFDVSPENEIAVINISGDRFVIGKPVVGDIDQDVKRIYQGIVICFNYAKNVSPMQIETEERKTFEKKTQELKECPNCKEKISKGVKFCAACGEKIKKEESPLTIKCFACGKEILSSAKFCNYCGQSLEEKKSVCSKCGKVIVSTAKFCNFCGSKVT